MSVPVTGGRTDGMADEGRDGDARGEGADGGGDSNGLFGEVDGSHGGREGVELDAGSDELKRGRSFHPGAHPTSRSLPPAPVESRASHWPCSASPGQTSSGSRGSTPGQASHPRRIHSAACPRTTMISLSKSM